MMVKIGEDGDGLKTTNLKTVALIFQERLNRVIRDIHETPVRSCISGAQVNT